MIKILIKFFWWLFPALWLFVIVPGVIIAVYKYKPLDGFFELWWFFPFLISLIAVSEFVIIGISADRLVNIESDQYD
ncbi:hypothetical protein [uncultured Mediterranean phage uvMED]|nr:hypothetical protein [uncultured Mediterranean phage uvMED]